MKRRLVLAAGLAGGSVLTIGRASAQNYPTRPVRWIVPFAPAGPIDALARKLAELASAELGQPIVIENKSGAGGAIGTAEVARAAPDGYTLGMAGPDALISTAALQKAPGFDARQDLTMIMQISAGRQILVANPALGLNSLTALVGAAQAKPMSISYVSWGPGSRPELLFKAMELQTGAKLIAVPYRGLGAALQDVFGNTVQLAIIPVGMATQYKEKGFVVPLAVMGTSRAPEFPAVKTSQEQGFDMPIMNALLWTGLFGPKALPNSITQRWVDVLQKVTRSADFEQYLKVIGQSMIGRHTNDFSRDFNAEFALITDFTRQLGFQPQ